VDTDRTTVSVNLETWRRLNEKKDPGDSMDDVIDTALDALEATA
jgi:predicted CopG family antitoxin